MEKTLKVHTVFSHILAKLLPTKPRQDMLGKKTKKITIYLLLMAFQDAFSCRLKHYAAKCVLPTVMNSEVNLWGGEGT